MSTKIIFGFLILLGLYSCLEPYEVNVTDYEDLLVVDALITDEYKNHRVYLSRSVPNLDETPQIESGALVIITDENNNEEVLTEITAGIYETDKLQFQAKVGGTYTLSIRTKDGENYQSTPCTILPQTQIDDVNYEAGKDWNDDETEELKGLHILVDGKSSDGSYLRWLYEEDWKFKVPYPSLLEYNYSTGMWEHIRPDNDVCWKNHVSNGVIVYSNAQQSNAQIKSKKVCFVPSEATDKLTIRYSILVRQLRISKEEFEFWNKLKISTENVGDVFGTQPFSITGNVKNVDDEKEPVLGYFQTGSVASKRIYINRDEVANLDLPIYSARDYCKVDTFMADGFAYNSPLEIYEKLVINGSYNLHEAVYSETSMAVIGLLLARPVCSDCTVTGNIEAPDFWED